MTVNNFNSSSSKTQTVAEKISDIERNVMIRCGLFALLFLIVCCAGALSYLRNPMSHLSTFFEALFIGMSLSMFLLPTLNLQNILCDWSVSDRIACELYTELQFRRHINTNVYRGCVYVIQDIDVSLWYKIGKSTAPAERIGHFDTMLPFRTRIVHIISSKDCNALEAMLHRHFAAKRQRGEWFALDSSDIAWLLALEAV